MRCTAPQIQCQRLADRVGREGREVVGGDEVVGTAAVHRQHLVAALHILPRRRRQRLDVAHIQRLAGLTLHLEPGHRNAITQRAAFAIEAVEALGALAATPAVGRKRRVDAGIQQGLEIALHVGVGRGIGVRRQAVPEVPVVHVVAQPLLMVGHAARSWRRHGFAAAVAAATSCQQARRRQRHRQPTGAVPGAANASSKHRHALSPSRWLSRGRHLQSRLFRRGPVGTAPGSRTAPPIPASTSPS